MRRRAQRRKFVMWGTGAVFAALFVVMAYTCSTSTVAACPSAANGSRQANELARARSQAGFSVLYPCSLPGGQRLETVALTGNPGRRKAELIFDGPFEMAVRQSQFPPPVNPDPTGAARSELDLFPNVRAILLEINDGSSRAQYHLFWERAGIHYEVQAVGPPLQRRSILAVATSLQ